MRHIEPAHRDLPGFVEDDVRGLRVDGDVELARGGPVARVVSAAHQDDLADPFDDARFFSGREGDVGQRAGRNERDRAVRMRHHGVDDQIDGMPRNHGRWRSRGAAGHPDRTPRGCPAR